MTPARRGRPTWAEVDLGALAWNLAQVRGLVGPKVKILAVVKANAYGHGAVPCARTLVAAGADALGVATVEEGAELRQAGLRLPIVILGLAQPYEAQAVVRLRLEATVTSWALAAALARAARAAGRRAAVHLKVDTGMGRIGLRPEEAGPLAARLQKLPGISVAGVFTHFAHADGRDKRLLREQWRCLQTATGAVRKAWPRALLHAANSAAVIESPETHADMVRPGLMLYGLYPSPRLRSRVRLRPALRWRTSIVEIKTVPAGTGLSYGHTFLTRGRSRIATLAVGYADGYSRALSNRGRVLVRGRRCPIVGRVCMDMCLADVTRVPGAVVGDEVVLLGRQGANTIGADDLAATLGTISYEIVCAIGPRVPRHYGGGRP
jgi:alanine racemase